LFEYKVTAIFSKAVIHKGSHTEEHEWLTYHTPLAHPDFWWHFIRQVTFELFSFVKKVEFGLDDLRGLFQP